jgi:hypothetical protein
MTARKPPRLTRTQLDYLQAIHGAFTGGLTKGHSGYGSTLTVRILEERGLITLSRYPRQGRSDGWRAKIRPAGVEALRAAGRDV